MEIKKYIVVLVSILVYFNLSFAQSSIINPINLDSNKFSVNEEKVSFSGKNITTILEIENKSKETYRTKISIKCIPQYYGGGSYSSSLIPFDFKLLENDKEIIFSIKYNDKYISKLESLETENHSISFIEFELDFLPKEIKYLTISYENEIDNFTRIFDTDYRLVEKHLFYQNSKKKIVQYISPKKTFTEKDIDYCLLDFIIKNNDEYIIYNNYRRIYQDNNFIWMFDVPDDIFEVVCRQDYFNPKADMSIFHIFYSDYFTDLEEEENNHAPEFETIKMYAMHKIT